MKNYRRLKNILINLKIINWLIIVTELNIYLYLKMFVCIFSSKSNQVEFSGIILRFSKR